MAGETDRAEGARGPVRAPQNLAGGLVLLFVALFALWATSNLSQGTLRAMGPAMMPRWLAIGVAACGIALIVSSFMKPGEALGRWALRGPLVVLLAVFLFAITIRPFDLGIGQTPGLGLAVAGPLAIVVGGYASPEARLRDLIVLALALTAFCMVLFGDLLNLPIPLFPLWVSDLFPVSWSNDARLISVSVIYAVAAAVIWMTGRRRPRGEPIDVAPPVQRY